jgi:hypothetical protein
VSEDSFKVHSFDATEGASWQRLERWLKFRFQRRI